jgi:toxin-antitoxin system PIN domain toxin
MIVPSSGDLLDANVWLALAVEAHTHHRRARTYWEREAAPVAAFCRVTQMAFLRLLTNPSVMGSQVLSPSSASAKTADFLRLPEVELFDEPLGVHDAWERFATAGRISPNLWRRLPRRICGAGGTAARVLRQGILEVRSPESPHPRKLSPAKAGHYVHTQTIESGTRC